MLAFCIALFPLFVSAQTQDVDAPIPAEFCREPGIRALLVEGYTIRCFDPLAPESVAGVCTISGRCYVVTVQKNVRESVLFPVIHSEQAQQVFEDLVFAFLPPESKTARFLLSLKPFEKVETYNEPLVENTERSVETFSRVCFKIPSIFSFLKPLVGESDCALAQITKQRVFGSALLESTTTTQTTATVIATSTPAQAFLSAEPALVQLGARAIISWGSSGVIEGTCRVQGGDGFIRYGEAGQVSSEPITGKSVFVLGCLADNNTPVIRTLVIDLAS